MNNDAGHSELDRLIESFSDYPMSEEEMEALFACLDAELDRAR